MMRLPIFFGLALAGPKVVSEPIVAVDGLYGYPQGVAAMGGVYPELPFYGRGYPGKAWRRGVVDPIYGGRGFYGGIYNNYPVAAAPLAVSAAPVYPPTVEFARPIEIARPLEIATRPATIEIATRPAAIEPLSPWVRRLAENDDVQADAEVLDDVEAAPKRQLEAADDVDAGYKGYGGGYDGGYGYPRPISYPYPRPYPYPFPRGGVWW